MCKFLYFVINFLKHGSQGYYSGKISSVIKMLPTRVLGLPRGTETDESPDRKSGEAFLGSLRQDGEQGWGGEQG